MTLTFINDIWIYDFDDKLPTYDKYIEYDIDKKNVSIVIAHRNDVERLCLLINDLESQDCINISYELIIVDDHSENKQLENLKHAISDKRWVKLLSLDDGINDILENL